MTDIFDQVNNLFDEENRKKQRKIEDRKKEQASRFYFLHNDHYEEVLSLLKERLEELKKEGKEDFLLGENYKRDIPRIEKKNGENITCHEFYMIIETLLEKIKSLEKLCQK